MSDQNVLNKVKSIPDGEDATITLTNSDGEKKTFDCIFKESVAPSFFLLFSADNLPADIDQEKQFPFTCLDRKGVTVSFFVEFSARQNSRILEFTARQSINLEDFRDYFRVNLVAPITVSFTPPEVSPQDSSWEVNGTTIDISQSGVLAFLPDECKNTRSLEIEISLPSPDKTIFCIGRTVRIKRIRKNKWLTALHFDQLNSDDKDTIAMNCLAEQRRQLREQIQV